MARPRTQPEDTEATTPAVPPDPEAATEHQLAEREGEAEAVAEQQDEAARAEERRARASERAAELKSVPEGAAPPSEKQVRGETQFQRGWLISNAEDVLGHPAHVVAGALHLDESEYLTVPDAQKKIERWLNTEVTASDEA